LEDELTTNRTSMTVASPTTPDAPRQRPDVIVRNLSKTFGGATALDRVSLALAPGEIHGLLGENGSGKSTLIKVLAGFHYPDAGTLEVSGQAVPLPLAPGQFQNLGFAFVHQDLGLIPALTVLENLRLPFLATSRAPRLSWRTMHRQAHQALLAHGVDIDTHARVGDLAPVQRSMLAIVRAVESISGGLGDDGVVGTLLVLDEPTVYLPQRETETLFGLVRRVAAAGTGVLFVSHDLDEVLAICHRVSVLRDGRLVGTEARADLTKARLVQLIVGHEVEPSRVERKNAPSAVSATERSVAARVDMASGEVIDKVSFEVAAGEVIGATGLAGSGFEELPYLLFGATPGIGTLELRGRVPLALHRLRPNRAVDEGIILVPGNRQMDGCVQSLSVSENVSLPTISRFVRGMILRHRRERAATREVLNRFSVRPPDPQLRAGNLSGGNQQKVLLAKWLQLAPKLLLFDEPTQGVDVGARDEIFALLRAETERGAAVVCASSDHEQLATICDRVLIFSRGHVVNELRGEQLTKEEITRQCLMSLPS
jgi:ribose transport system ATP-binding protein